MEHSQHIQNDVIDLRELFTVLKKSKKLILGITLIATLLAAFYAFVIAKPVYQVKSMVEIGKINAGTKEESTLDNIQDVKEKLEYHYGVKSKKKRNYPKVNSISVSKKSKSIFSVIVEGRSNTEAIDFINKIVKNVKNEYRGKVNSYVDTQKELIALTQSDIKDSTDNLQKLEKSLENYNQKIMNISVEDAALAGIYTIQISQNQEQLQRLQSRISALKAKEYTMKLSISPLRIKQTHTVGEVEVLEKPIKPKKVLIVLVAFITGLMLAIFFVFFLSFLRGLKEEK